MPLPNLEVPCRAVLEPCHGKFAFAISGQLEGKCNHNVDKIGDMVKPSSFTKGSGQNSRQDEVLERFQRGHGSRSAVQLEPCSRTRRTAKSVDPLTASAMKNATEPPLLTLTNASLRA